MKLQSEIKEELKQDMQQTKDLEDFNRAELKACYGHEGVDYYEHYHITIEILFK